MTPRTIGLALAIGTLTLLPAAPTAQEAKLAPDTVVDLGTLGHDVSFAVAINDKRQVIGWIADNFTPFLAPFVWEDGVMRELTAGPDLFLLYARDIDDRGRIVGWGVDVATFRTVALLWDRDGQVIRLPALSDLDCAAEAINRRGDVAGYCYTSDGAGLRYRPVLWRDGEVVDLGVASGGQDATAYAINDRGAVLGAFRDAQGFHAGSFVWADGVLTRLDPALVAGDINNRGQITGGARLVPSLGFSAFILNRGTLVTLPSPGDAVNCLAGAINQHAAVGGTCGIGAVVWVDGRPRPLPGLSEFASSVTDVNDRGDAVGGSVTPSPDNNTHAVLWPGAAKHPPRRGED